MNNETKLSTLPPTEHSFLLVCAHREAQATEYKLPGKKGAAFTVSVMCLSQDGLKCNERQLYAEV